MPLETATYITDLVASNPAASDALSTADDHMRLIKGVLKATFPNFTAAALNSTQAQIDTAVGLVNSSGVQKLSSSAAFAGNPTDVFQNPVLGEIDFVTNSVVAIQAKNTSGAISARVFGALTVDGTLNAAGVVPIGGMIMWLTDTLPTVGQWCWANGGVLSRTGNGFILYNTIGTTYGAGDGSTTFNVINMQEVVPVGKSTMGGASSPGLLTSISAGVTGVLNGLFGSDTHALSTTEMPAHSHANSLTDPGHVHGNSALVRWSGQPVTTGSGTAGQGVLSGSAPNTDSATTGITITNASAGSGAAHTNVQPSRAVNFIIRIG